MITLFAIANFKKITKIKKFERTHILFKTIYFLIRSADDSRNRRLNLFSEALLAGIRAEVSRLEALAEV